MSGRRRPKEAPPDDGSDVDDADGSFEDIGPHVPASADGAQIPLHAGASSGHTAASGSVSGASASRSGSPTSQGDAEHGHAAGGHSRGASGGDAGGKFVCDICGYAFKRLANLRLHSKKHLGPRQTFSCPRCPNLAFGRVYELRRHQATAHGEGGAPPARTHVCPDCGSSFNRADALKRHRRRSQENLPCRVRRSIPIHAQDGGFGIGSVSEPALPAAAPVAPAFLAPAAGFAPEAMGAVGFISGSFPLSATHGPESPMYDFAAPSPADGSHTALADTYRAWNGSTERGNVMLNGGPSPAPASPLDLLALVSPEPTLVAGAPVPVGDVDAAGGRKPEPNLADRSARRSASLDSGPLALIESVPFPILTTTLLPSLPMPAPVRPLPTLFPTVPPSLLPPWPITSYLIQTFFEFAHVRVQVLHPPTFIDEVVTGRADPTLFLSVLWSGVRMADAEVGRSKAQACGPGWERVFAPDQCWIMQLMEECMRRVFAELDAVKQLPTVDLDPARPDPFLLARLTNLLIVVHLCRFSSSVLGFPSYNHTLAASFAELFRLCKFGELAGDTEIPDPGDLNTYIRRSLRARQCVIWLVTEAAANDSMGAVPELIPEEGPSLDASGTYSPAWGNMRMCSGPPALFDVLPAATTAPEIWAGILEAQHEIELPHAPYSATVSLRQVLEGFRGPMLGEVHSVMSMPVGDPRRRELAETMGREMLRGGSIWFYMALSNLWNRFVRCKSYFASRNWRLHADPPGSSEEECRGRRMRQELVGGIAEFFSTMHPEIAALVEQADGKGLRDLGGKEWGRIWRSSLPNGIVFVLTFQLILNCPSDIFDRVMADETWPFSPEFVEAEALAITVSRIVRSSLRVEDEGPSRPGESQEDAEKRYRRRRVDELKRISPVHGLVALRACWVHVIAIRKLKTLLHSTTSNTEIIEAALRTVRNLIDDVDGVLEGLMEIEGTYRNVHSAYTVIRNLVERDIESLMQPLPANAEASVWIGPSPEDMQRLMGKLPASTFAA